MLPQVLAGWNVRHVAEGVVLTPPAGANAGAIRIRERTELWCARDIVRDALTQMAAFDHVSESAVEPMTTSEGEYAGLCTLVSVRWSAVSAGCATSARQAWCGESFPVRVSKAEPTTQRGSPSLTKRYARSRTITRLD